MGARVPVRLTLEPQALPTAVRPTSTAQSNEVRRILDQLNLVADSAAQLYAVATQCNAYHSVAIYEWKVHTGSLFDSLGDKGKGEF